MSDLLETRARRAYELGRLRWALRLAPLAAAAALVAVLSGRPFDQSCAICGALILLSAGLAFRGGSAGRAVAPGLVAGVPALAMPVLSQTLGHLCFGPVCASLCIPACIAGGVAAGAFIALRARGEEHPAPFLLAALLVAGVTGVLGCTLGGAAGVAGMLAGTVLGGAPVLAVARR